jgi:hypothetical protein
METHDSDEKVTSGCDIDISHVPNEVREGSIKLGESEVFSAGEDGVDFRTVGWIRGSFNDQFLFGLLCSSVP